MASPSYNSIQTGCLDLSPTRTCLSCPTIFEVGESSNASLSRPRTEINLDDSSVIPILGTGFIHGGYFNFDGVEGTFSVEERARLGNMDVFGLEKGRLDLLLSSFSKDNSEMDGFTIDADFGSDKEVGGEDWGYEGYDSLLECNPLMKIDSSDLALDLLTFEEPYSDCRKILWIFLDGSSI
nr:hypothetical protein CFP56_17642 [Quercus suber]